MYRMTECGSPAVPRAPRRLLIKTIPAGPPPADDGPAARRRLLGPMDALDGSDARTPVGVAWADGCLGGRRRPAIASRCTLPRRAGGCLEVDRSYARRGGSTEMGCAASSAATGALSVDDAAPEVAEQQQPPPQLERSEPMPEPEPEREPVQVGPSSAGHMYTVGEELGKGSFGVVVKFIREDSTVFAAKCFNKEALKRKRMGWGRRTALDSVFEEIAVMKLLDHPNVLKLHEVMDDDHRGKIFLVVEYMPHGSCDPKEHGLEFFEEERARRYFNDTLLGLEELHNHGILHHDIKPENLLLTQDDRVKIGDLGIAQVCVPAEWDSDGVQHDDEELRKVEVCTSWAGTPAFLAPEVARGLDSFDGAPVDIWALGVSLWHMVMGTLPFCE